MSACPVCAFFLFKLPFSFKSNPQSKSFHSANIQHLRLLCDQMIFGFLQYSPHAVRQHENLDSLYLTHADIHDCVLSTHRKMSY